MAFGGRNSQRGSLLLPAGIKLELLTTKRGSNVRNSIAILTGKGKEQKRETRDGSLYANRPGTRQLGQEMNYMPVYDHNELEKQFEMALELHKQNVEPTSTNANSQVPTFDQLMYYQTWIDKQKEGKIKGFYDDNGVKKTNVDSQTRSSSVRRSSNEAPPELSSIIPYLVSHNSKAIQNDSVAQTRVCKIESHFNTRTSEIMKALRKDEFNESLVSQEDVSFENDYSYLVTDPGLNSKKSSLKKCASTGNILSSKRSLIHSYSANSLQSVKLLFGSDKCEVLDDCGDLSSPNSSKRKKNVSYFVTSPPGILNDTMSCKLNTTFGHNSIIEVVSDQPTVTEKEISISIESASQEENYPYAFHLPRVVGYENLKRNVNKLVKLSISDNKQSEMPRLIAKDDYELKAKAKRKPLYQSNSTVDVLGENKSVKFDYVPNHAGVSYAEKAAETAEMELLSKLQRSNSYSKINDKLKVYREHELARDSLERRVDIIKHISGFDTKGNRIMGDPKAASNILHRNRSEAAIAVITKQNSMKQLVQKREFFRKNVLNKKETIESSVLEHRLKTQEDLEKRLASVHPKHITVLRYGFASRWFHLEAIMRSIRLWHYKFQVLKETILENRRLAEIARIEKERIEREQHKIFVETGSANLICDFMIFFKFGRRIDWKRVIMKFNLSGKIRRLQGWFRKLMLTFYAQIEVLTRMWLREEDIKIKDMLKSLGEIKSPMATKSRKSFFNFSSPLANQHRGTLLGGVLPGSRGSIVSTNPLASPIHRNSLVAPVRGRQNSVFNSLSVPVPLSPGPNNFGSSKSRKSFFGDIPANVTKVKHDMMGDIYSDHQVNVEIRDETILFYLREKRRAYRAYKKSFVNQIRNWMIYNREAIEVQKMKFLMQGAEVPSLEVIQTLLGCPILKPFKWLPSHDEMLTLIDTAFRRQQEIEISNRQKNLTTDLRLPHYERPN